MTTVVRAGRGPPLVLLHCLGVDRRLWEIAAAGLQDRFELVSYDFPGHGTTPVPQRPYTIEDLSEQLASLLEQERLARVHLAGISLGGLVAQCAAANNPDIVDRLVLIDTTPRYTDDMRAAWHERAAVARARGVAVMTDRLLDIWFTPDCLAGNGPAVRYVRECFACCAGEGYALACEALAAADLRPILPKIAAPTLVVCGRQDVPSFIGAAFELKREIKNAELAWLEPARHASILEQPGAFRMVLERFLAA
jgi:3-oxoadipate enol-lactonase